jgi:hypothetical protein
MKTRNQLILLNQLTLIWSMRWRALLPVAYLLLTSSTALAQGVYVPPPQPVTPPISLGLPTNSWQWIPIAGARCDDNTSTGIGVNLAPSNSANANLLIFFAGGGACWDYPTCTQLPPPIGMATHGPFGQTEFNTSTFPGMLDRNAASNPFRDWNMVFIPYCTSDEHAGDAIATYMGPLNATKIMYHVGRNNVIAAMLAIDATWPHPQKVMVSGGSAGGLGATFNYDFIRSSYPSAKVYLLNDAAPLLVNVQLPVNSWRLEWLLNSRTCANSPCETDISAVQQGLERQYPMDRMALTSSEGDFIARAFLSIPPGTGLLLPYIFAPSYTAWQYLNWFLVPAMQRATSASPNFHYFLATGIDHTLTGSPVSYSITINNVSTGLWTWISQQVNDDPNWKSLQSP